MVNVRPIARFSLVDDQGRPVTETDFHGSFQLVYFGFTHCRIVCPRWLTKLSSVFVQIGSLADEIVPLYITVDPARDTPEVMREYLKAYPRFTGLSGSEQQIGAAKAAFRVFAERRPDREDPHGYVVPHTAIAYLMGPDGLYVDHFSDALDETEMAERIKRALQNS